MSIAISTTVRRVYKPIGTIVFVVLFFVFYNTYLVDRSIVNLKIALTQVSQAENLSDLQKIKALLKIPILKEVIKSDLSSKQLLSLESIDNISSSAVKIEQAEDVKFFLRSILKERAKSRGPVLTFFDNLNEYFFKGETQLPEDRLKQEAASLSNKIKSLKDKTQIQRQYYALGCIYLQLSDTKNAEKAFLNAVEAAPDTELANRSRFNIGWSYKIAGQHDKAAAYFEQLGQELTNIELAITSKYERADALFRAGDYKSARDAYAQLAEESPDEETKASSLLQAGLISMYKLKDFQSALKFFYEFAMLQAGNISYFNLNESDAALGFYTKIEEKEPHSEISNYIKTTVRNTLAEDPRDMGFRLLKEKRYLESLESFNKAVAISSNDGVSYSGMALDYYWSEQKETAIAVAQKAVEIVPENEVALVNALFVLINTKNVEKAILLGERFNSKKLVAKLPELYYNLGYAYAIKADMKNAITNFDRAIRLNQEYAFAYNNLGCVMWSLKNYSEAIKRFQEATHRYPAYADAYFNLGVCYFNLQRYDDAYREFEKTLDVNPAYQEAVEYLERIKNILKYVPED